MVVVGTGAGMGIDSSLPDFRGNQDFWNNYPPYRGQVQLHGVRQSQFPQDEPTSSGVSTARGCRCTDRKTLMKATAFCSR